MKQYNYKNLKEDTHVYHLWSPLKFTIKDNYHYIPTSFIFNLFSNILYIPIGLLLFIINYLLYGYKIENKHKILKNTGLVSISNHLHPMDCTMIGLIYFPHRVYYPTLQSNFKIPFIRHLIRILYAIPIPTKENQKKSFYKQINSSLRNKKIIQMYPEGSLWPYYEEVRNFKYGAFKMAVEVNTPIQPIRFLLVEPTGIHKLYKRKKSIHAIVLDPIYPNNDLEHDKRIEDLKKRTYEVMKGVNI